MEKAERRIRSRFGLQHGGLEEDGIAAEETDLISALTGTLTFAGGQPGTLPFISSGFLISVTHIFMASWCVCAR